VIFEESIIDLLFTEERVPFALAHKLVDRSVHFSGHTVAAPTAVLVVKAVFPACYIFAFLAVHHVPDLSQLYGSHVVRVNLLLNCYWLDIVYVHL